MNTGVFLDWVVETLARWLLALRGRSLRLESAQPRDRRGRFRPDHAEETDDDFMHELGYTRRMLRAATPFTREPDEPLDAFQLRLRNWVLDNMDNWINARHCSPWTVFANLKDTWAMDRLQYATQLSQVKAQAAALPRMPKVGKNTWVAAYVPRSVEPPRSERFQRVAEINHAEDLAQAAPVALGNAEPDGTTAWKASLSVSEPSAIPPDPQYVVAPKYDPDYDVVAGLPKKTKDALCPNDYRQGFGNDTQGARENFEARNKAEFGGVWSFAKVPCRVYEAYDAKGRSYFVARAALDLLQEQMQAKMDAACTVDDSHESGVMSHESEVPNHADSRLMTHDSRLDPNPRPPPE